MMLVKDYTSPGCFDESLVEGGGQELVQKLWLIMSHLWILSSYRTCKN